MERDFQEMRELMVREQLVVRGIKDEKVLEAFRSVPRHLFVPYSEQHLAYRDHPLGIGRGQTISQPYIVALMTEALGLEGGEKVLEIGTGSGYQAAILAEIADTVYTVERIMQLQETARKVLDLLGYSNIRFRIGDGTRGWPEEAPFDRILVTAAALKPPPSLLSQLSEEGGRMVIPAGNCWSQDLLLITREKDDFKERVLCGCRFVPLIGNEGHKDDDA